MRILTPHFQEISSSLDRFLLQSPLDTGNQILPGKGFDQIIAGSLFWRSLAVLTSSTAVIMMHAVVGLSDLMRSRISTPLIPAG